MIPFFQKSIADALLMLRAQIHFRNFKVIWTAFFWQVFCSKMVLNIYNKLDWNKSSNSSGEIVLYCVMFNITMVVQNDKNLQSHGFFNNHSFLWKTLVYPNSIKKKPIWGKLLLLKKMIVTCIYIHEIIETILKKHTWENIKAFD